MSPKDSSRMGEIVLVGVDGSPEARDAAVLGRRVAEAAGGSLHLVTAASEALVEVAATRAKLDVDRLRGALLETATTKAVAGLQDHFEASELSEILTAGLGPPQHVIAEAGRALGADLFVLGGHRRGRASSWLRKGTAQHLLRVCDSPVLVTGPEGPGVERVVAAVDRSFAAAPTIAAALRLATLLGAPFEAVHVAMRPPLPVGIDLDLETDELFRMDESETEAEIRSRLPADTGLTLLRGDVVQSLVAMIEGGPPTVLALGAQGRGWVHRLIVGSTTRALLAELPTSLLIVPSTPPSSGTIGH